MKWAVYDLLSNSPSFDFLSFLQVALHKGAGGVKFIEGWAAGSIYGTVEEQKTRFDTIIKPICELLKLEISFQGLDGLEVVYPKSVEQGMAHLACNARELPRPYPVNPSQQALDKVNDILKGKRPVVVSLRTCSYHSSRNSGPDWERWAKDHEAVVIKDWYEEPIPLDERLAYYELASMNLGVAAGHMALIYYSYRPYLMFKILGDTKSTSPGYHEKRGLGKIGSQLPYATKLQKFVWEGGDSYDEIEREFQKVIGG